MGDRCTHGVLLTFYCNWCANVEGMMRNPAFHALLDEMKAVHDQKNADYAEAANPYSNFEFAAQTAGVTVEQVFRVLIGVKLARLQVLRASGKAPNHESLADTEKDLAVYAALLASYNSEPRVIAFSWSAVADGVDLDMVSPVTDGLA